MASYELGWIKDQSGRNYLITWDDYVKKVYAKYTSSGVFGSSSHYEIEQADSPEEAMMKARIWVLNQ